MRSWAAKRRGHVATNVAEIAKAPRLEEEDIEPFTIEEVQSLLVEAAKLRNSTRWVVALALGLRQGEALGLHWEDVDLDTGYVRIRKNRLRPKYAHGCGDNPCGRKAGYCPQKQQTRREHKSTKSRAGRRTIGLPDPLIKLLRRHQDQQTRNGSRPEPTGRTRDTSSPPRPAARSAPTPAATVLLILGVPDVVVDAIMGWEPGGAARMRARYMHVTGAVLKRTAHQVGEALWGADGRQLS